MKKITEKTFLELSYLSPPLYSPDGKMISFLVRKANYAKNDYDRDIFLIKEGKTIQLTSCGTVSHYCWTNDNTILFSADPDNATMNRINAGARLTCYYEIDPSCGESKLAFIIPLENTVSLTELRDGLFLVLNDQRINPVCSDQEYKALKEKEKVYETFEELPFWKLNLGTQQGKRNYLWLYDRKTGCLSQVNRDGEHVVNYNADSDTILYSTSHNVKTVRDYDVSLHTYDIESGERTCIMKKGELKLRNCEVTGWLWGDRILILGSKGEKYGRTQSPELWIYDRNTGELNLFCKPKYNIGYRNITGDHLLCGGMIKVVDDRVYFTVTDNYNCYVQYFDREGNWSEYLTPCGSVDGFDVCQDRLVYTGFHGIGMHEIYENGIQLTHLNEEVLSGYSLSKPEHLSFINSDGIEIDGWVMKPVGYQEGKKYPGMLHIHGGPRVVLGEIYFHENQMWANDGYFVFFCNPRGSEGKGDDFADIWGANKMGYRDYQDIMEFTDYVLEKYPDIDSQHLGVNGGSFGGFMTNWVIGHTDRFAAAASQRSISNWVGYYYSTSQGYTWVPNFHHANPRDCFEQLWDNSPLKYAQYVKTPTLFIVSTEDHECWMVEGIQMYTGVKMAGTPARLLMFKGETHELSRSGKPIPRLARLQEMHSWMNQYLKPTAVEQ